MKNKKPGLEPGFLLEHFQQKCEAVLRGIMRKNKGIERVDVSVLTGIALSREKPGEKTHRALSF
ncbi:hypothetical protein WH297_04190 [Ochrobactrum vermis]|uniref:Ribosome-binding factor A n=1 Tax=Ochrobactrum vermis TaxID=1827297 RepID=A0ABU8P9K6_9HYPH|nr:hypothetical protein [Ochrobactrum vermis]PQZ29475.1 hypothetical protein CQZ93_04280 [Ochrobactrum vermis]